MNTTKHCRHNVNKLDQTDHADALQIHSLFQRAYRVEAQLIGVRSIPPLDRTVRDIMASETCFFGCWDDELLIAAVEVEYYEPHLGINSLVVHPDYFRQGLGRQLLRYVLAEYVWETAKVETALANLPAITLYEQFGFKETLRYSAAAGITKVAMRM